VGEEGEEEGEAFHCGRGLVAFCVFGVFRGLFGGGRVWGPSLPIDAVRGQIVHGS